MVVTAETLEKPLMNEVFRQLDFTPYAEEVLARLEMEGSSSKEDLNRWKRELKELERVQDSLLSALRLAKNEAVRQRIVDDMEEAQARLDSMRANPPAVKTIRPDDFGVVRDFLADLEDKWQRLSRQRRNRLLKLLIDRVELTPKKTEIDAAVIWKTGVQQQLTIERPGAVRNRDHVWTSHDKQLLTTLWPSADPETITQAFPNRTWQALACQAHRLGLKRRTKYERKDSLSRWTPEELDQTRQKYEGGIPVSEIAQSIGRSEDAVIKKATKNKWYRPREAKWPKAKPNWQTSHFSRLQESPSHTSA
jgi:hypothetical protein